jgi:methylthioribose-1-phosphate isomerase
LKNGLPKAEEMSEEHAGQRDTGCYHAAFDVTGAESIAALVTERCLIQFVRCAKVKEVLGR